MRKARALLGVALVAFSSTSQALLIGDNVTCTAVNLTCSSPNAIVAAGPEFSLNNNVSPWLSVDIDGISSTVNISNIFPGAVGPAANTSLTLGSVDDTFGDIIGITNFTMTGITGFSASDITFTPHSLHVNLVAIWDIGSSTQFSLVLSRAPQAVPEPSSLTLFALAFAGLSFVGFARKRRPSCNRRPRG